MEFETLASINLGHMKASSQTEVGISFILPEMMTQFSMKVADGVNDLVSGFKYHELCFFRY